MWDKWIRLAVAGTVLGSLLSVALASTFLGLSLLFWLLECRGRRNWHLRLLPFWPLLLAFAVLTGLSVLFSADPWESARYLKKLLLFAPPFLMFTYFRPKHLSRLLPGLWILLGASALVGVLQYAGLREVDLMNRISGFMGHYMTFSGQVMLGSVALTGFLLLGGRPLLISWAEIPLVGRLSGRGAFWWGLWGLLLLAMYLTLTRSAWFGAAFGIFYLLFRFRPRGALALLALAILSLFLSPPLFRERLRAGFDLTDTTTRIRLELLYTGKNIILEHPWLGVGPYMVPRFYDRYNGTDEFPSWVYQHLHNNLVQIGAELGAPAALVWLGIWIWIFFDLTRFARRGSDPLLRAASRSAGASLAAFLIAGLFEFNYGDSEVLTLLLCLLTVPYVLERSRQTLS